MLKVKERMMKCYFILVSITIRLCACAPAINQKTSDRYAEAAFNAQQNGDWNAARVRYAKALVNAELGNKPAEELSVLNYEYGRSLGVTCFFDEAELYINKSLELDQENNGPIYMALLELARLNYDQKKYQAAISYFDQLLPIYSDLNAEIEAPMSVAAAYEEYSIAQDEVGNTKISKIYKEKSATIKLQNIGGHSITERTPYGTQCVQ